MSRTPIRDVPFNQPRCRLFISETCRIVDRWSMAESENVARSKTTRGEGLVPRWGRGGASHNPPCHFAVPSLNSGFSYLGVPAQPTGPSAPTGRLLYSIRRLRAFSKCMLARLDERIRCLHLFDLNRLRCKDNSREVPIAISPTWNYRSKGVGHRARHKHLRAHAQPPY